VAYKIVAAACFALTTFSASASPIPILNFEGSADGALIQDFYNGGTDSYGNYGGNYGVTFSGGIVRVVNGLTYLTNVSSIRIANAFYNGVSFSYSTRQVPYSNGLTPDYAPDDDDFRAELLPAPGSGVDLNDSSYLGNTTTGYCQHMPQQFCLFSGAFISAMPGVPLGGFNFSRNAALDTIAFGSIALPANEWAVPEPTTLATLGLGILGLIGTRRKSDKIQAV
jgi:hypothetical protein